MIRFLALAVLATALPVQLMAQYDFGDKKFENLYFLLEEYYADYDYEGILDAEEDILSYVESRQDTLTATIYTFLGESYLMGLGDRQTSLDFYQKELELREEIQEGEDYGRKDLLYNIAAIQDELGDYDEAEAIYTELLESDLEEFGSRSIEYYETALAAGVHYKNVSQYDDAIELYKKTMKGMRKNHEFYPFFMAELGANYFFKGAYQETDRSLTAALEAFEDQGLYASTEYVATLISYANLYKGMGKYPEALAQLEEATNILERLTGENEEYFATIYNNTAAVNMGLGNAELAKEYYEKSLELEEMLYGSEDPTYAITLGNLADTYMDFYQYSTSEELYKKALEIFAAFYGEDNYYYANTLTQLAYLYRISFRFEEAIEAQNRSIEIYRGIFGEDQIDYAWVTNNLGDIYASTARNQEADRLYQTAMTIREKQLGTNHPLFAESANRMAINKWAQEQYELAEDYYEQTFDNYFKQIEAYFPILSEEEKAKFYSTKLRPAFEQFNSFAFEGSRESKHLNGLMYDYQLATKGLIMYATNKVRQAIFNSGDTTLINKYNNWISYKEQLSRLYSTLELEAEERNRLIDSLTVVANDLERDLSASSQAFASTFTTQKVTWKDVQEKLEPNEAAVEIIRFRNFLPDSAGYYNGEIYYAALIVTKETEDYPELVLLRSGKDLETKFLAYYRNMIKFGIEDQYSYNQLWRPIANRIKGKNKVFVSPDGVFNQISIYTLLNPATGKFLIDEIEVQMVTNSKDLISFADASSGSGEKKAYLFGYPNYNKGAIEDRPSSEETGGQSRSIGGISRGLRGNLQRYIDNNNLLALLPGTKKEVELITALYDDAPSQPIAYLEDDAIETTLKSVNNPHTLHIATHGFFLEDDQPLDLSSTDDYVQNPLLRSGLIFAGANSFLRTGEFMADEDEGQDGILTAFEAMNMNLDETELVVLSACETGLGEVTNGEGVYGLQRSFQIAGAKTIIMSMWTVDDAATQELMTNFYTEWLASGNKPAAFKKAQQTLKEKYENPYYWGAFVMVGQ